MGAADLMPGISGGTVAFVSGIYKDLMTSIKSFDASSLRYLFSFRLHDFFAAVAWQFLLVLGLGLATSFMLFSQVFAYLLNHESFFSYLYGLFLGFVMASIFLCLRMLKTWKRQLWIYFSLGLVLISLFFHINWKEEKSVYDLPFKEAAAYTRGREIANYDAKKGRLSKVKLADLAALVAQQKISAQTVVYASADQTPFLLQDLLKKPVFRLFDPWVFFCGSIAVCAMLLPGISGGYLLNVLGLYPAIIAALADLSRSLMTFTLDLDAFVLLLNLFGGACFGAVCFSRFVLQLFDAYREKLVAFLIGMMAAAMPSLWPFWETEYHFLPFKVEQGPKLLLKQALWPDLYTSDAYFVFFLSFLAFYSVYCFEKRATQIELKVS